MELGFRVQGLRFRVGICNLGGEVVMLRNGRASLPRKMEKHMEIIWTVT